MHHVLLNRLGLGINSEFCAINTRAIYILLSKVGLEINFIKWILLRSYNDTQFVAVALFAFIASCAVSDFSGMEAMLHTLRTNSS